MAVWGRHCRVPVSFCFLHNQAQSPPRVQHHQCTGALLPKGTAPRQRYDAVPRTCAERRDGSSGHRNPPSDHQKGCGPLKTRFTLRASPPMEPTVQPKRPRVRSVWRCHWLSKGRAKTKQITSQNWARLDVSDGGPLLWRASIPTDSLKRISITARSSRNCQQATGHAFHWLLWFEQGTSGWPNDSAALRTGLFGVGLPLKLQNYADSVW